MAENKMRRNGHGPGSMMALEKAKNFKSAILRLFKELKGFRKVVAVALVLAAAGSILTIFAPNILSDLTDEISAGLVINTDNLELLTTTVTNELNEEKMAQIMPQIINFDFSKENIFKIMSSTEISDEEKETFQNVMANIDADNAISLVASLPNSIAEMLLSDSEIEGSIITVADKIQVLNFVNGTNKEIPNSITSILLNDIEIDDTIITNEELAIFVGKMSQLSEDATPTEVYAIIDEMPESIQNVVEPFMNIAKIKNIAFFLVVILLISAVFTYIESICMTNVANKFANKLRRNISVKINKLPLKYFDNNSTGDTLSRVTNDVDTIAQSMNQSLSMLVSAFTLFVGTLIMMFITNYVMAITAIVSSLIGFIFMFIILAKSQKYFVEKQNGLGNLNGHIEEIYSGLNVVKTYNGKNAANEEFDALNKKMYNANWKSQFLSGLMMPMMSFIGNFGYVAVCIVGALLTMNGYISFGVIVAFISYVRLFTSPLSQMAQAMTSLQSTAAASERVFEFLDEEEMFDESHIMTTLKKEDVKGKIEFKNVVFKYDGNDKPTINDFSATALPGQKIAIVGPTGAGKTTMVNLLMKFYEINSGDIIIDGISTKNLRRENIHSLFTMVLQDTWLFSGTVRENIVYNRKNVSDADVERVCKTVGLDHFIRTLPNGYDTDLSDNDSVSAGQRQLLTIARGMIEDAPFLILDEATSNVDTRTEELVQKAMDILTEGRTSFIIAHRLSTIKNADLILVMKDGNIIEQGNHDELMKQKGFYADLYNSQFEL